MLKTPSKIYVFCCLANGTTDKVSCILDSLWNGDVLTKKNQQFILNSSREHHISSLVLQTGGWTDKVNNRVASLLKLQLDNPAFKMHTFVAWIENIFHYVV